MFLSENTIKEVALKFLKAYYKYRPRKREDVSVSSLNMRTAGGIIADGFYAFKKPDATPYVATFEATSYHTKDEIKYKIQKALLFWDGLAVSSLLAACVLTYGYVYNHFTIKQIGLTMGIGLVLVNLLVFYFLFRLLASKLRRYRYIYAIEQFKKYHADEQWCAFGEDVFEDKEDKYLNELKDQCVYNGFGLVRIDKDLKYHVVITPARHEVFSGKRSSMKFITQGTWYNNLAQEPSPGVFDKLKKKFGFNTSTNNVLRFQKSYWPQLISTGIAFALIAIIFYREIQDADLVFVDRTVYLEDLSQLTTGEEQEPSLFVVDTAVNAVPRKETWWDDDVSPQIPLKSKPAKKAIPQKGEDIYVENESDEILTYDCSRFYNLGGRKYIVEEGIYDNINLAQKRLNELKDKDLDVSILWIGCFSKTEKGYSIYFDLICNTELEALQIFGELINAEITDYKDLRIRDIELLEE